MDFKEETDNLLFELKKTGWNRVKIQKELQYKGKNYITEVQSRGGNETMYNAIKQLYHRVLADDYIEYDMAAGIKKIEAKTDVILTAIAELLSFHGKGVASKIKQDLESLVNKQLKNEE